MPRNKGNGDLVALVEVFRLWRRRPDYHDFRESINDEGSWNKELGNVLAIAERLADDPTIARWSDDEVRRGGW